MRIAIVTNFPFRGYSGGRYHAYVLGQCLALKNNKVVFITDTIPKFEGDFNQWEGYSKIEYIITKQFILNRKMQDGFDYVIVIPTLLPDEVFCNNCGKLVSELKGKLVVVNFETPNWYNQYLTKGRDLKSLYGIKQLLHTYGGIVLSSAETSKQYAREYYGESDQVNICYEVWRPAINTIAADTLRGKVQTQKRILSFVRLHDRHKGADDLLEILSQPLNGYTVVLVVGTGIVNKEYRDRLNELSQRYHFTVEIKKKLSDIEKFVELWKANILLFPTKFEGYGYPPVEARYCNTLCITYDLPVLREINGNQVRYCEYGNVESMKMALKDVIEGISRGASFDFADVKEKENCIIKANQIDNILRKYKELNFNISCKKYDKWMYSKNFGIKRCAKYFLTFLRAKMKLHNNKIRFDL